LGGGQKTGSQEGCETLTSVGKKTKTVGFPKKNLGWGKLHRKKRGEGGVRQRGFERCAKLGTLGPRCKTNPETKETKSGGKRRVQGGGGVFEKKIGIGETKKNPREKKKKLPKTPETAQGAGKKPSQKLQKKKSKSEVSPTHLIPTPTQETAPRTQASQMAPNGPKHKTPGTKHGQKPKCPSEDFAMHGRKKNGGLVPA